jgi:hypothetical protein
MGATPTSRRAPAVDALIEERDALCAELIALDREAQPRVSRAARIEARLKQIAGERGESFRVTLSNGDYVYVSPPVPSDDQSLLTADEVLPVIMFVLTPKIWRPGHTLAT